MQSSLQHSEQFHLAVIMDGNGRWATCRGLPRSAGHAAGAKAARRVIEAAPDLGIGTLTLFAFSADNWRRPTGEIEALLALLRRYLRAETERLVEAGVRLTAIGRRDRLPPALVRDIASTEGATAAGSRLHLRVALDYSSRYAIAEAAMRCSDAAEEPEAFAQALAIRLKAPPVDLVIRTGGEQRLSDFLLWESAYAELWFTPTMWPDFGATELAEALADFRRRERRFGAASTGARVAAG